MKVGKLTRKEERGEKIRLKEKKDKRKCGRRKDGNKKRKGMRKEERTQ